MRIKRKIKEGLHWMESRFHPCSGVLLYHRVAAPVRDRFGLCVSPEHFEAQMAHLSSQGGVLPIQSLMECQENREIQPGSVAVTFDDGYVDVLQNALPILEKHQIPATVFVTTGSLGKRFWWDRLLQIVESFDVNSRNILLEATSIPQECLSGPSSNHYDALHAYLSAMHPGKREESLKTLEAAAGISDCPEAPRSMSEEQLKSLSEHPLITIGAHTTTHRRLSSLPYEEQLSEVKDSTDSLSLLLDKPVEVFSYPFGLRNRDYNSDTLKALEVSGIRYAFAADRNVVTTKTDHHSIPRIWIHDFGQARFQQRLHHWLGTPHRR